MKRKTKNKKILEKRREKAKDKEWAIRVKEKFDNSCIVCGKKEWLNAHHIIPKEFKIARWDLNNGVALCPKHHKFGRFSAHRNALWFINLIQRRMNKEYQYLLIILKEIWKDAT